MEDPLLISGGLLVCMCLWNSYGMNPPKTSNLSHFHSFILLFTSPSLCTISIRLSQEFLIKDSESVREKFNCAHQSLELIAFYDAHIKQVMPLVSAYVGKKRPFDGRI